MARLGGFEPPTNSLEGYCSIQLSYGAVASGSRTAQWVQGMRRSDLKLSE